MSLVKSKIEYVTLILAILMLVPCYFSLSGLFFYFTNEGIIRSEGLIVIGFMSVFSIVIAIPYAIIVAGYFKIITKRNLIITALPFILMVVLVVYGTTLGVPW